MKINWSYIFKICFQNLKLYCVEEPLLLGTLKIANIHIQRYKEINQD